MLIQAGMAELADALDLGSSGVHRAGSSPVARSIIFLRLSDDVRWPFC